MSNRKTIFGTWIFHFRPQHFLFLFFPLPPPHHLCKGIIPSNSLKINNSRGKTMKLKEMSNQQTNRHDVEKPIQTPSTYERARIFYHHWQVTRCTKSSQHTCGTEAYTLKSWEICGEKIRCTQASEWFHSVWRNNSPSTMDSNVLVSSASIAQF